MIASTYTHHSIVNTSIMYTSQHFYVCMVSTKQIAEIQGLLVNKVCFHLLLSGCGSEEPGNMYPCNSDA